MIKPPKTSRSTRSTDMPDGLYWILAALAGLVLLFVVFQQHSAIRTNMVLNERTITTSLVQRLSASVGEELQKSRDTIETIAAVDSITAAEPAACQQKLEQLYRQLDTSFLSISRMTATGKIDCSSGDDNASLQIEQYPYLLRILNDPTHAPVLSPVSVAQEMGSKRFVDMHVPIFRSAEFEGTIGTTLLLEDLETKLSREYELDKRATVALVDTNGDVIYHNETTLIGKNMFDEELFSLAAARAIKDLITTPTPETSGEVELEDDSSLSYSVANVFPERDWLLVGVLDDSTAIETSLRNSPILNWVQLPLPVIASGIVLASSLVAITVWVVVKRS